jgi:hypothetical protein
MRRALVTEACTASGVMGSLRQRNARVRCRRPVLPQAGSIIRTFSIGAERAAAAALLFARAADTAADLASLTGALTAHDLLGYRQALGWYTGCRWSAPTGEWRAGEHT